MSRDVARNFLFFEYGTVNVNILEFAIFSRIRTVGYVAVSFFCGRWYNKHTVTLPLNGREAVHVVRNEDVLERIRYKFEQVGVLLLGFAQNWGR